MGISFIDRLHEAAFIPESWPSLLDDLARLSQAQGGFLFAARSNELKWTSSASLEMGGEVFASGNYLARTTRAQKAISTQNTGFLREADFITDAEMQSDPLYAELLLPAGLGGGVATIISPLTEDLIILTLERSRHLEPVSQEVIDQLNSLRPHIARAVLVSARLRLERARAVSTTLELMGVPAVVVDDRGKALATNQLADKLSDFLEWRAFDRISLKDRLAATLFAQALSTINQDEFAKVRSFPIRTADSNSVMVAHLLPIRLSARDIFSRSDAILVLTSTTAANPPSSELLQSLFDLTPSESRIARTFASGATIDDVSETVGISRNTVRAHLRSIMDKTGCNRQAEIVALLSGITSFPRA